MGEALYCPRQPIHATSIFLVSVHGALLSLVYTRLIFCRILLFALVSEYVVVSGSRPRVHLHGTPASAEVN